MIVNLDKCTLAGADLSGYLVIGDTHHSNLADVKMYLVYCPACDPNVTKAAARFGRKLSVVVEGASDDTTRLEQPTCGVCELGKLLALEIL